MQPAVLRRAVEKLTVREAFAARQVHAALSAAHHVFCCRSAAPPRGPCGFSLVGPEEPVHDDYDQRQQEIFQSPPEAKS